MDTATIVNIVLCILSFSLASISVVIVVLTIRQNNKMIESSTRPYIAMYIGTTYFSEPTTYLIIKNFGNSTGTVINFDCSIDLSICAYEKEYVPLQNINGTMLCPQQSIQFPILMPELISATKTLSFDLTYSSTAKSYLEHSSLSLSPYCDRLHLRADTNGDELRTISYALQDIAEKML